MRFITLEQIKQQIRVEEDFTLEDDILELYGSSAEDSIIAVTRRSYENFYETYGEIPSPVKLCALLMAASAYKDREAWTSQKLEATPAFSFMLKPYCRLANSTTGTSNNTQYGCKNL